MKFYVIFFSLYSVPADKQKKKQKVRKALIAFGKTNTCHFIR